MIQRKIIKHIVAKRAKSMLNKEQIQKTSQSAKKVISSKLTRVKDLDDLKSRSLTALFYVGGSYAAWRFLLKPAWKKYKQKLENEKIFTDPNAQQASILRKAIIGAGTDEKAIMQMARKITDWKAVQKSYNKLTGNNLNEDLKSDLSSKDYNLFLSIVNRSISNQSQGSKQGYLVLSSKNVRIRNTPDSTKSAFGFNSNVLDTASIGILLGFATGKTTVDSKGVQYYQVRIKFTEGIPDSHKSIYRKQGTRILSFWVGAGAIELFRHFKEMRANYPNAKVYKGTKDTGLRQILK